LPFNDFWEIKIQNDSKELLDLKEEVAKKLKIQLEKEKSKTSQQEKEVLNENYLKFF